MRTGRDKDGDEVQRIRRKPGRVPTSCAECRRLKLRCDKNVPCEKCMTRGCGSICPNGSLTPGKGNRLVLANTEELHDRIEQLCSRIRDLEHALRSLQESVSAEPHPLLQTGILQSSPTQNYKQPKDTVMTSVSASPPQIEAHKDGEEPQSSQAEDDNFVDAFGTLTLGLGGQCSFLGKTARSEYLIHALAHRQPCTKAVLPRLSKRITEPTFPEIEVSDKELGREVFSLLPPLSDAVHLCEVYHEHGKYMYTPVPRTELFDEILTNVYRADSFDALSCHHSLGLLFIVFAIATLFDPDQDPYSISAQEFYHLSRTALGFTPQTTRLSIQALIHIAQYLDFSDSDSMGSELAWMYIGHAVRLGHSIGLHLNSARWNLSEPNIQRRCRLFWQLFYLDTWASFCFGRPPNMSACYVDCPIPKELDDSNTDGEKHMSFHSWNWQYVALLHSIMATAFGPKLPTYSVVLSLDRRVRDFPVPPKWRPVCGENKDQFHVTPELQTQRWIILSSRESTLLNLHRAYFAQALQEMPTDLAHHRYIPSVFAIYRSAWRIIEGLVLAWRRFPHPLARTSLSWSQALSAAIVMCLFVTRAPTFHIAPSALSELDSLLNLFQDAAPNSRSAANLLASIQNLHRKAHEVMDHRSHGGVPPTTTTPSDVELDRIGGKTHLLAEVGASDSDTCGPPQSVVLTELEPSEYYYFSEVNVETMHPTLAQDMQSFDAGMSTLNKFFDFPIAQQQHQQQQQQQHPVLELHVPEMVFYPSTGLQPFQYHPQQPPPMQYEQSAPILDATWQSFVEQLGF